MTIQHHFSLFSRIHSASEKGSPSTNTIIFEVLEQSAALLGATFVMDRSYDSNTLFLKMAALEQDYVVRLKSNRKLLYHNQWVKATELRNRRKGKVKLALFYKGKHGYLVLVYGLSKHPMMLITNKVIHSKAAVTQVAKLYFSRWRIEEYFRCKKQVFQFENFRVRKLVSINTLNFYISLCMAF